MSFFKNKRKFPKLRKNAWFVSYHWSYLPMTWQGYATYIPYGAYLLGSFFFVYAQQNDDLLNTLFAVIPYWVAGIVVMQWFASHKS